MLQLIFDLVTDYENLVLHIDVSFHSIDYDGDNKQYSQQLYHQSTLDEAAAVLAEILRRAKEEPEALHAAPASTPVGRPDETAAARRPVVRYAFPEG